MYNHPMSDDLHLQDVRLAAIQHHVDELYQAKEYQAAYDIMTEAEPRFPDELVEIRYWRACLAACSGDADLALRLLDEIVSGGAWYSVRQLREEDDLAILQGKPPFERIAETCLNRQQAAQASSRPTISILEPPSSRIQPSARLPLMLALHGNSQTADHALHAWRAMLNHGYILAAPYSSQIAWDDRRNWTDLEQGTQEVRGHLGELEDRYHPDMPRSVIGGFSMGAGLALLIALQGGNSSPAHFVLVGPYLPDLEALDPLLGARHVHELRGYIVVGDRDDPCCSIAKTIHEKLVASGYAVEIEVRRGLVHDIPLDFEAVLERALNFFSHFAEV
jgi:predicted esterase